MKSAHACEAFDLNYEIHSYGPTLNLSMYLNVALAVANCDFAEIMVPQNLLSMGMADRPTIDRILEEVAIAGAALKTNFGGRTTVQAARGRTPI